MPIPEPNAWRESIKWEFEAYPLFTSVYNKSALPLSETDSEYYACYSDFLCKFENGYLVGLEPAGHIAAIGNTVIEEALSGEDGYLDELRKTHAEIRIAIDSCLKARSDENVSLSDWWPQTQEALSHTTNIIFCFDHAFDAFLKEMQKKNPEDYEIMNDHIVNRPSFMDDAGKRLLELDRENRGDFDTIFDLFMRDFSWFQNTYTGSFEIDQEWLKGYLEEMKRHIHKEKAQVRRPALPQKFECILDVINEDIVFRDDKKKLLLLAVDLMGEWVKVQCEKNDWKFEVLRWLSMGEILEILEKGKNEYLDNAEKYHAENKRFGIMTDTGYSDVSESFWNETIHRFNENNIRGTEISGAVANKGYYKGIVKVVLDARKEAEKFHAGDVLVTSMTRPEFLPLMNRAGAFLTDEGGISCHAAIIAREMGKPCIIGTKIATQVLHDGDFVEVDADHGVVRVVERSGDTNMGKS